MRNLIIDIGNTRIKYGVFEGTEQLFGLVKEEVQEEDILRLATNHKVQNIIYSTVAQSLSAEFVDELNRSYIVLELTNETLLPIVNKYATPATLGKDRIAAVVGAQVVFPNQHCLIVDAGTCMTLDVLRADGAYLGGNITPGVRMRLRAMHEFTARLPLVEPGEWDQIFGVSTSTAIENGGVLGAALEVEALIGRLRQEWPGLKVVMTGGDAGLLASKIQDKVSVHLNLVLVGLHKILTYNVEKLA